MLLIPTMVLLGLFSSIPSATAQERPQSVFIETRCSGSLSGEAIASLRDSIRQSSGYRLASAIDDDGGYKVVITLHIVCIEGKLFGGEGIASFASTVGRAACTFGSCNETFDKDSLATFLCSGPEAKGCGKDLYSRMDEYMSGPGQVPFGMLSKARMAAGVP